MVCGCPGYSEYKVNQKRSDANIAIGAAGLKIVEHDATHAEFSDGSTRFLSRLLGVMHGQGGKCSKSLGVLGYFFGNVAVSRIARGQ